MTFGWVKVIESYTSEFLTLCHFLLVNNCTRGHIIFVPFVRYSLRQVQNCSILLPLAFNASDGGFPGTIYVKCCMEVECSSKQNAISFSK